MSPRFQWTRHPFSLDTKGDYFKLFEIVDCGSEAECISLLVLQLHGCRSFYCFVLLFCNTAMPFVVVLSTIVDINS